ncbi:helix-turn-helix domain-containing protein (plasmid) [Haladaptatus sp. SPP-AMP-3]|uniref:helix-turn-helix domain-containing protein n=1 Tax=Haladaptatus sp. SPP-AMP-3 TaxID=3121295 RepID=UPI003C2F59DE
MRYATIVLTWGEGVSVHPVDDLLMGTNDVAVETVQYVGPVYEGRYVEFVELHGDLDVARALLADSPETVEYDIVGEDDRGVLYLHCQTTGLVDDLLTILREQQIVLDWPMRYIDTDSERGLQLTVLGTSEAIRRAAAEIPEGISLRLERMGEYEPDTGKLSSILTERQETLFDLAVREGYYEVPRETTHRELADELGLTTGTVSERLQRIEAKLVSTYVD